MSYHPVGNVAQWVKITKTYEDFAAASTTNNISIFSLLEKTVILNYVINPVTSFSGGSIISYSINIGYTGNENYVASPTDIFTGSVPTGDNLNSILPISFSTTTDIRAYVECDGDNLDSAVQGVVDIYLLISTLP